MEKIGFIGLGNMGKGMAINLSISDYKVYGYDINEKVFDQLSKNSIYKCNTIKKVVDECNIIITMLPDGKIVEKVWLEILEFIKPGKYLIDCSTIDVKTSISLQKIAQKKSLYTLDAPVSGGVIGADNGTLTFMVGG